MTSHDHYVAVYGTLRSGGRAAHLWEGRATSYGLARLGPWELRDYGAFPFAIESGIGYQITVEVLGVSSDVLAMFDRYEGYPSLYSRRSQWVFGVDGHPDGKVPAWIYHPTAETRRSCRVGFLPVIRSGDWFDRDLVGTLDTEH